MNKRELANLAQIKLIKKIEEQIESQGGITAEQAMAFARALSIVKGNAL